MGPNICIPASCNSDSAISLRSPAQTCMGSKNFSKSKNIPKTHGTIINYEINMWYRKLIPKYKVKEILHGLWRNEIREKEIKY